MRKSKIARNRVRKPGKNSFVMKSGNVIKIHRNLTERWVARRDQREHRRAERMIGLPKSRIKRLLYHMQPKRMYRYWTSRDGGIMALKIIGVCFVVIFLLMIGVFAYFRKDLPNLKDVSGSNIGGSTRYYDRTGQTLLWEDYDAVKRIPVKNDQISKYVKDATVAVEDKDFFKHGGFDVRGIMRAGINDVFKKGSTQGGSTITQQLVKLTQDWTKDRTIARKIKEVILAVELERMYSKDDILAGYLNTAPYGNIQYGVEAAARDYFHKSAKDLTLDEAAFLAALPKSPSYYSPYGPYFNKEALVGRQHYIIDVMLEQGMISKNQRDDAKKIDTVAAVHPKPANKFNAIRAPWFVLAAKAQLEDKYGDQTVKRGGWTVITTIDLALQDIAEQQVQAGLAQVRRQGGDNAAFAAEDVKTGQMVALVGGGDFNNPEYGQINYAQTPLPPGSSFKPYDYIALIENKNTAGAGSVLYDTQGPLEGYPCTNKASPKAGGNCLWDFDFRFPGPLTLRYALGGSRNVPAVKAMLAVGVNKTIETAEKLGLKSGYNCYTDDKLTKETQCYASSAIGDGAYLHLDEHVHGFASISRNGLNIKQTYILKIIDANNKTRDEWKLEKGTQAVRQESAYIVADILSDPNASYFPGGNKPQRYGNWKFGMKTGTTNDGKDGWMMGFSTQYAAGVWVGYHTRRVVMRGFMETMTQPIWQGWMRKAHDGKQPFERPRPSGIQTLPAYIVRSNPGLGAVVPSSATDLYPSWYKPIKSSSGAPKAIDIISNKLATDCTPALARKDVTGGDASSFSVDPFAGTSAVNTNENDDVHKCDDTKPSIQINALTPSTCTSGSTCTVVVDVFQGTHPLSSATHKGTINIIIGGQNVGNAQIDASGTVSVNINYSGSGSQSVQAQIIDSVLYDGSDTTTINFTAAATPLVITNPSAGQDVNADSYEIKWTGGNGNYSVTLNGSVVAYCTDISSKNCTVSLPGGNNTSFTAVISSGGESQSVTFKK